MVCVCVYWVLLDFFKSWNQVEHTNLIACPTLTFTVELAFCLVCFLDHSIPREPSLSRDGSQEVMYYGLILKLQITLN